jgi:hypothetical protein
MSRASCSVTFDMFLALNSHETQFTEFTSLGLVLVNVFLGWGLREKHEASSFGVLKLDGSSWNDQFLESPLRLRSAVILADGVHD